MADRYRNRDSWRQRESQPYRREYDIDRQAEQLSDDRPGGYADHEASGRQMGEPGYGGSDYQPDNRFDYGYERDERFSRGGGGYARRDRDYGSEEGYGSSGSYNYGPARVTNNQGRGFRSFTSEDQGGRDFVAGGSRPYGGYGRGLGSGSARYASGYYDAEPHRGHTDAYRDRGFWDRAGDEVASWFGDEDAAHRREMDHSGRGPQGYNRSDERILEDACDNLTDDWGVDARNIQVTVENAEVTLDGTVDSRRAKRRAEDCVDRISGVRHVQNNLRVDEMTGENRETRRGEGERTTGTLT